MAEWFKRGTVNTFYRGSNPLKTLNLKILRLLFNIFIVFYFFNYKRSIYFYIKLKTIKRTC